MLYTKVVVDISQFFLHKRLSFSLSAYAVAEHSRKGSRHFFYIVSALLYSHSSYTIQCIIEKMRVYLVLKRFNLRLFLQHCQRILSVGFRRIIIYQAHQFGIYVKKRFSHKCTFVFLPQSLSAAVVLRGKKLFLNSNHRDYHIVYVKPQNNQKHRKDCQCRTFQNTAAAFHFISCQVGHHYNCGQ